MLIASNYVTQNEQFQCCAPKRKVAMQHEVQEYDVMDSVNDHSFFILDDDDDDSEDRAHMQQLLMSLCEQSTDSNTIACFCHDNYCLLCQVYC